MQSSSPTASKGRQAEQLRISYKKWKLEALQSGGWFPVFNGFKLFLPALSGNAVKLYLYFGLHSKHDTGESWHSLDSIAQFFGKSTRAVSEWIKELEDSELIQRFQFELNSEAHTFLHVYPAEMKLIVDAEDASLSPKDEDVDLVDYYKRLVETNNTRLASSPKDLASLTAKAEALIGLGAEFEKQRKHHDAALHLYQAISTLKDAREVAPYVVALLARHAEAQELLGHTQFEQGQLKHALRSLTEAIIAYDRVGHETLYDFSAHAKVANCWVQVGRIRGGLGHGREAVTALEKAVLEYERALVLDANSPSVKTSLGYACLDLADALIVVEGTQDATDLVHKATTTFEQVLQQFPGAKRARNGLALATTRLSQYEIAASRGPKDERVAEQVDRYQVNQNMASDPSDAFLEAYTHLEYFLARLRHTEDEPQGQRTRDVTLVGSLSRLYRDGFISRSVVSRYIQLRTIRNKLMHGRNVQVDWIQATAWCEELAARLTLASTQLDQ